MAVSMLCLQELQLDLECSICTEPYQQPRVLSCQHVFCLKCLESLCGTNKRVHCPLCRKTTLLNTDTRENVAGLPKPTVIEEVGQTINSLVQSLSGGAQSLPCELCPVSNVRKIDTFCHECLQRMCNACFVKHLDISGFEEHTRTAIADLPICESHPVNFCQHYCTKCKVAVCVKCLVHNHKGHDSQLIKTVINEAKGKLQAAVDFLQVKIDKLNNRVQTNVITKQVSQDVIDDYTNKIRLWRDDMVMKIEEVSNRLITDLVDGNKENMDEFDRYDLKIQNNIEQLEDIKGISDIGIQTASLDILQFTGMADEVLSDKDETEKFSVKHPELKLANIYIQGDCSVTFSKGTISNRSKKTRSSDITELALSTSGPMATVQNQPFVSRGETYYGSGYYNNVPSHHSMHGPSSVLPNYGSYVNNGNGSNHFLPNVSPYQTCMYRPTNMMTEGSLCPCQLQGYSPQGTICPYHSNPNHN